MLGPKLLGLTLTLVGICLVVSGVVLFTAMPEYEGSENAFCTQSFCLVKRPIYCYKTSYGISFDSGWILITAGIIIVLSYRKQELRQ